MEVTINIAKKVGNTFLSTLSNIFKKELDYICDSWNIRNRI